VSEIESIGSEIGRIVLSKSGSDVRCIAGKLVRLPMVLNDAE
jgi:hypothetical protein